MADSAQDLSKRYYNNCGYGYYYGNNGCYYSGWSYYGRWILLAVILFVAFAVFFSISCLNARRRRRRGISPITGTGWMAPAGHGQAQYTGNQSYPMNNQQQQYQPPSYAPPSNTGANAGYYGGQEGGVTAPAGTYQPKGGENVYAPPEGPPPNRK